jgi:hypothetical protein
MTDISAVPTGIGQINGLIGRVVKEAIAAQRARAKFATENESDWPAATGAD